MTPSGEAVVQGQLIKWVELPMFTGSGAGVPLTRTIEATLPLRIDGGASGDMSANRTLSIPGSAGTVLQGGSPPVYSEHPAVTSIALGSNPAHLGELRIPNAGTIRARNASGNADVALLLLSAADVVMVGDSTHGAKVGGTLQPTIPLSGDIGKLRYVSAAGVESYETVAALGLQSNPSLVVSGYDRAWEITRNYAFLPGASPSSTTIGPILGADYHEAGAPQSPTISMVMSVELVIVGDDGSGHTFERTFKGALNKYGGSWNIGTQFQAITGLDVGTCSGTFMNTITRAGTDDGDIGAMIDYGYSGTIYSTWVAKLRIFGGGKYT
jgi:hypothetical protein